ncbi:P2X purinoceptor 1 isoform X2 [Cavia porcellus]|uniref:P2X purinoceptor 1 isoform X2 n=1 Tax=Cavia porcellus TaxID=10141 RepID=UPI002FE2C4CC
MGKWAQRAKALRGLCPEPVWPTMARRLQDELAAFFFEYDTPRMVLVRNKKVGVCLREGLPDLEWPHQQCVSEAQRPGRDPPPGLWSPGLGCGRLRLPSAGGQLLCGHDQFHRDPPAGSRVLCRGIRTGKCVAFNDTVQTCEIFGWCPVEVDDNIPSPALLREAENFTLFIKNSISFPRFKVNRRNLVEEVNASYMKTCLYHKTLHPLCPVFNLGYVVQQSGQDFRRLAEKGGVVGITIDWNCDLDWNVRHCKPIYEFHGLYGEKNLSPGFNFRFARHFVENGTNYRHLFKVFGIRFDILVDGKAGKFDIIPTMTTIGSGIGIFGVATVLCDLLLLHILPKRHYYKQKKFKYAEDMGPGAGEHDPVTTSSTLGLQENMRTS